VKAAAKKKKEKKVGNQKKIVVVGDHKPIIKQAPQYNNP
jgi:hypothetical protein